MSRARDANDSGAGNSGSTYIPAQRQPASARKLAFAAFIRRALEMARTTRAWNGLEVARRTGVSRQTINRWARADWSTDPERDRVIAFCEGLGIDPAIAFETLEWHRPAARPAAFPPMDPDVEALLRKLIDPAVAHSEKQHIKEMVRYLAHRPPVPTKEGRRPEQTG